jgi:VIT1/CCC1 family predicted Fe2+/Mn2+ transporter
MDLMGPEHFLMPFIAHALGTLAGAMLAARLSNALRPALSIGFLFFLGGAYMIYILPSPLWFSIADLMLAYLPMAWLGYRLGRRMTL